MAKVRHNYSGLVAKVKPTMAEAMTFTLPRALATAKMLAETGRGDMHPTIARGRKSAQMDTCVDTLKDQQAFTGVINLSGSDSKKKTLSKWMVTIVEQAKKFEKGISKHFSKADQDSFADEYVLFFLLYFNRVYPLLYLPHASVCSLPVSKIFCAVWPSAS